VIAAEAFIGTEPMWWLIGIVRIHENGKVRDHLLLARNKREKIDHWRYGLNGVVKGDRFIEVEPQSDHVLDSDATTVAHREAGLVRCGNRA